MESASTSASGFRSQQASPMHMMYDDEQMMQTLNNRPLTSSSAVSPMSPCRTPATCTPRSRQRTPVVAVGNDGEMPLFIVACSPDVASTAFPSMQAATAVLAQRNSLLSAGGYSEFGGGRRRSLMLEAIAAVNGEGQGAQGDAMARRGSTAGGIGRRASVITPGGVRRLSVVQGFGDLEAGAESPRTLASPCTNNGLLSPHPPPRATTAEQSFRRLHHLQAAAPGLPQQQVGGRSPRRMSMAAPIGLPNRPMSDIGGQEIRRSTIRRSSESSNDSSDCEDTRRRSKANTHRASISRGAVGLSFD